MWKNLRPLEALIWSHDSGLPKNRGDSFLLSWLDIGLVAILRVVEQVDFTTFKSHKHIRRSPVARYPRMVHTKQLQGQLGPEASHARQSSPTDPQLDWHSRKFFCLPHVGHFRIGHSRPTVGCHPKHGYLANVILDACRFHIGIYDRAIRKAKQR